MIKNIIVIFLLISSICYCIHEYIQQTRLEETIKEMEVQLELTTKTALKQNENCILEIKRLKLIIEDINKLPK